MTDRGSCSRVELDGRRIVVDLSDADLAQLLATAARRGLDGSALVLGWIQYGLVGSRPWEAPRSRADRVARDAPVTRDVDVARESDELFRDLLGRRDDTD